MQTLAFLWYELEAAKRHVEEAFAERQSGKADSSFLNNASESHVIDERAQRRWHLSLRWIAKKEARVRSRPFLQERY